MLLPNEIVHEILEWSGSHNHYIKFQSMKYNLCKEAIIKRIKTTNSWEFEDIFDKEDRYYIYQVFEKCNCCEIHKIDRPDLNDYHNKFCPQYKTHNSSDKECKCMCRHICRNICRMDNDEVDESL